MAVFSDKGAVCSDPLCRTRDFLPFVCNKCSQVYCVDHYMAEKHNCARLRTGDRRVFVCPKCLETVFMHDEETDTAAARRHAPACDPRRFEERKQKQKGQTCPIRGCKERLSNITTYDCKECGQKVCLKHRLQEDHNCFQVREEARKARQQKARAAFRLFTSSSGTGGSSSRVSAGAGATNGSAQPPKPQRTGSSQKKGRCTIS